MDLLKFIVTATYFSFRGIIYQQMFGASSSQFVYGMAGEAGYCHGTGWTQTKILEAVCGRCFGTDKEGSGEESYGHINTIDPTGNIKFTYEEEEDKQILFLDPSSSPTGRWVSETSGL